MSISDQWRPTASMEVLRARAQMLETVRAFFREAGVLEVETPVCSRYANTDPALAGFETGYSGPEGPEDRTLYLHTSPEFPMKRLLAAGSGAIYQICKVFRDGERGRRHNPEFTLLEWYRPGFDYHRLMEEVATLVNRVLPVSRPVERIRYGDCFRRKLGIDPHRAGQVELKNCALERGIPGAQQLDLPHREAWLDLLLTHCIEPELGRGSLTFLYDYPAAQAALARLRPGEPPVAERFELYLDGMELANGFQELTDGGEQRRRFERDLEQRGEEGGSLLPMDETLLAALESGLPDCAGVALGLDRLLMSVAGVEQIDQVLAFPLPRA